MLIENDEEILRQKDRAIRIEEKLHKDYARITKPEKKWLETYNAISDRYTKMILEVN